MRNTCHRPCYFSQKISRHTQLALTQSRLLRYRPPPSRSEPTLRAEVAQLVEHSPEKAGVVSSILTLGTIFLALRDLSIIRPKL